jgi:hypothetical protein
LFTGKIVQVIAEAVLFLPGVKSFVSFILHTFPSISFSSFMVLTENAISKLCLEYHRGRAAVPSFPVPLLGETGERCEIKALINLLAWRAEFLYLTATK